MVARTQPYCPERGDIIWINFTPQSGKEITKRKPALVLSPKAYNNLMGLCVLCPITSKIKGHDFEIPLTVKKKPSVVKSDQIKSFDWKQRQAAFIIKAPKATVINVLNNISALLFENM